MTLNISNTNRLLDKFKPMDKSTKGSKNNDHLVFQKPQRTMDFKLPSSKSCLKNPSRQLRIHTLGDSIEKDKSMQSGYQTPKFNAEIKREQPRKDNFFSFGDPNKRIKTLTEEKIITKHTNIKQIKDSKYDNKSKQYLYVLEKENKSLKPKQDRYKQKEQKEIAKYTKKQKPLSPNGFVFGRDRTKTQLSIKNTQSHLNIRKKL